MPDNIDPEGLIEWMQMQMEERGLNCSDGSENFRRMFVAEMVRQHGVDWLSQRFPLTFDRHLSNMTDVMLGGGDVLGTAANDMLTDAFGFVMQGWGG